MASECKNCPRLCKADRSVNKGYCNTGKEIKLAKYMVHFGEEPPITGTNGSGAIFFSGCNLRCAFCQNYKISDGIKGEEISGERLEEIIFELSEKGVHNINLVTATHFIDRIIPVLKRVKPKLNIPIVYNCGGYERVEVIKELEGLIDIYLPDFKYMDSTLSERYSKAPDYYEYAIAAIREMVRQQPKAIYDGDIMKKGVIIRHLILPKAYKDSINIIAKIAEEFKSNPPLLSIMRQYTPCHNAEKFPEINRKLTSFEYDKVVSLCAELGLKGFTQEKGCETLDMTPEF